MELHTARRLSSERQRALSEVASVRPRLNGAVNGVGAGGHRSGSDGTASLSASLSAAPPVRRTPMAPAARPASQEMPEGADSPMLAATATLRRTLFTVLVLAQTAAFAYCMATKILPYHGREPLEIAILALSTMLFVWISLGFWTALSGFVLLCFGRDRYAITRSGVGNAPIPAGARTAVIMPICNEHVVRVFAGLRATYE